MKDTPTPDSLRPGDLVGPWQIEGYAGRGSYGAVYKARRAGQPHSKPVALKIAVFPSDPRFSREVGLLSRNSHPGMPRLLDQGWWHASPEVAHPFVVMEWIRGRSLYEWARVNNPSCRDVLRVLAQVARALEVLHRGECLHRDVKGDNILVGHEGRAVLVDFGSGTWKGAPPLTEWVVPPNTREYRSPESLRRAQAKPAQVARMSVVERAESDARAWDWRRVLLAAFMSLAVVGPCWMAPKSSPAPSEVVQTEAPAAEWAPDAGTRGLGEDALTERVESQEMPLASEPISRELPREPLPGQRRPPCPNRREAVINGACWKRLADITPPCGDSYYEWESSCYDPVMERTRLPTTQQPQ